LAGIGPDKALFDAVAKADFAYLAVDAAMDRVGSATSFRFRMRSITRSAVNSRMLKDGSKLHSVTSDCSLAFKETIVGTHCIPANPLEGSSRGGVAGKSFFCQRHLEALGASLKIAQTARAQGRPNRSGYIAIRLEII
jgi:hypothetical protein